MKGKNKYLPVCAAMYANYAAHGFGLIILTQTAAWLMEKFNTDMVGVSYLVSVMAIGKIVILAVSGVLSDKFGRKPFVFLGIASYIVFFLGIYFARSYSIAVFFALFAGAGNSFLDTGSMPAWIEAYPKAGGTVTILQKAAVSVGQLLLPVCLAFFISRNMSTSNLYLVATAILVIAGIVIARAPFPPLTKAPEKGSVPVDEDGNARFNSKPKLWLGGACLIAIGFTSTASFTLFSNWVKIFGQEIIGMSETSAAYCISMYSTTSIIGVVVTSIAIKKFIKPCRLLVVYPLLSVVALLLLAFAPSAAVCRIASIVIGWTAAGGVLQMAVAVMADLFPMGKGKVTSVVYMLCSICMLVIPTVAGWVYKASGSTSVMLLNAGITLLGALLGVVVNVRYNMLTKGVATA